MMVAYMVPTTDNTNNNKKINGNFYKLNISHNLRLVFSQKIIKNKLTYIYIPSISCQWG